MHTHVENPMSRSVDVILPGRFNRCGRLSDMAATTAVVVTLGGAASIAVACPEFTSRMPFDGQDGQLSQNVGGAVVGSPLRAADDFLRAMGNGNPWSVREVRAVMLVDWVSSLANLGLQVFNDGFSASTGAVPGTSACDKLGAASITDLGITIGPHHADEVRFALSESERVVLADRWY